MENWNELFAGKVFITDIGATLTAEVNEKTTEVGRYAVFSPNKDQDGHQIIEVGDNVEALCKKYKVKSDCICSIN